MKKGTILKSVKIITAKKIKALLLKSKNAQDKQKAFEKEGAYISADCACAN